MTSFAMTSFAMHIEYAITRDDDLDGNPILPGIVTDDTFWALVQSFPDSRCTLWRRLLLTASPVTDWRTASGDETRAPSKPKTRITSMDMTKYNSSEHFVKVEDVRNGSIQSEIAVVKDGKYDKPNIILETGDALSLNATNLRTLVRAYGSESDYWIGKQIELFLGEIEYQGSPHEAVLVKPISPPIKKEETQEPNSKPTPKPVPDMDDEIPF